MPSLSERTVLDLGQGSYVVCLPKAWFRYYGLKPGDKVEVISNGEITIRPKQKEPRGNKASLPVEGMRSGGEPLRGDGDGQSGGNVG
jgi:bifunctional DNA-binding transcriptional regulator/antitoxin component of YhaV-PrlF toxin-antitoxin module